MYENKERAGEVGYLRFTEEDLGGRLGRQPEDDESEEREKNAGQDEDVVVEDGDPLELDTERQVRV